MKEITPTRTSCLDPLRSKIFRIALTVNIISSVGNYIHYASEKLQMRNLVKDPTLHLALLESANTLPIFILGLMAGVVGDVLDRRNLLLASQSFMLVCAASLAILTFLNVTTPNVILITAFLIGTGSALGMPAYQALVPELVEHKHLIPDAIIINTVGYNLSRVLGPILGSKIFELFGASWAFCINAVSFVSVLIALMRWKRDPQHCPTTTLESPMKALRVGLKYLCTDKALDFRKIILWAIGYCWFGSVIISLTMALAVKELHVQNSFLLGISMSCPGIGAVVAMFIVPALRKRFKINSIFIIFGIIASICHLIIASTSSIYILVIFTIIAGISWLAVVSTVNTVIQLSIPTNLKARAFGVYHVMWGGTMSMGGIFWGHLATNLGIRVAYIISAVGVIISLFVLSRVRITTLDHLVETKKQDKQCYNEIL